MCNDRKKFYEVYDRLLRNGFIRVNYDKKGVYLISLPDVIFLYDDALTFYNSNINFRCTFNRLWLITNKEEIEKQRLEKKRLQEEEEKKLREEEEEKERLRESGELLTGFQTFLATVMVIIVFILLAVGISSCDDYFSVENQIARQEKIVFQLNEHPIEMWTADMVAMEEGAKKKLKKLENK
jgi:predicted ribosome quality control (RQC) complex YloA/Tae2 family protein